jgi:hypothetical protein
MGAAYAVALAVSFALATDPPAAPQVEKPLPPVVRPKPSAGRFVQRRLARPSAGEGTPLVWCPTRELPLARVPAPFPFEPDDAPVITAWPAASCAWLVRDLDADGAIKSGRELFGSFTTPGDANGFAALAALDSNGDGVVDARDDAYGTLRLWFDRNADREVQPGELEPLDGLTLPLRYEREPRCTASGDCTIEQARLTRGWLLDLHFAYRR